MKGYISKYEKAVAHVERNYSLCTEEEKKRVVRQVMAKYIVGNATIGKVNSKLVVHKQHSHDGINFMSKKK